MTHGESRLSVNVWLCPKRLRANLPRDLTAALDLCRVSVPSEASRTLPSLESIQKVFEQQLHPGIHQRSQVSCLEGGQRRRERSVGGCQHSGEGGKGSGCATFQWDSGDQFPLLLSLASFWLQCRGHTVSCIPTAPWIP